MSHNQYSAAKSFSGPPTHGASSLTTQMLNQAMQYHQSGRVEEAEQLYRKVLEIDPHHTDGLHLLGVAVHQKGHHEAALELISQAIQIKGNVSIYHNSLGTVLSAQGKTKEAAAAYERALNIDPDYAEAHLNMGNILMDQGKLVKAMARYERALVHKPDYAEALVNLGNILLDLGKLDEAIASYERALAIKPNYADAYNNLGNVFLVQGRIDDAQARYERALAIKPDSYEARYHLNTIRFMKTPMAEWDGLCRQLLQQTPLSKKYEHELYIRLAIPRWAVGNYGGFGEALKASNAITDPEFLADKNFKNMKAYEKFLNALHKYQTTDPAFQPQPAAHEIALIGDSHVLSYANTTLSVAGVPHRITPYLIMGCKAWHLSGKEFNQYKWSLDAMLDRLPPGTKCIVSAGEIDCRYNEGIIGHYKKQGGNLQNIVAAFVQNYVQNVVAAMRERQFEVTFLNVSAPNIEGLREGFADFTAEDEERLAAVIRLFNDELARATAEKGCRVIDVYSLTAGPEGKADGALHNDEHHLKPNVLALAFGRSLSPEALA